MFIKKLRFPKVIIFLAVLNPISFASNTLKKKKLGDYNIEITESSRSDFSNAKILDKKGDLVLTLDHLYSNHYHHFELKGEELFWIKRTGDDHTDKNWEDQLWVTHLKSKKSEKLIGLQGLDFRSSPDGQKIAFCSDDGLKILNRHMNQVKTIAKIGDGGRDDGFTLLNWSKDSKKFWFGSGVVDSWSKLGLYEEDQVRWLPYGGASADEEFDPNRGWLVTSDAPFSYDSENEADFQKSKMTTHLTVIDVLTGKKAELAKAPTNRFNPTWTSEDILEYSIDGRKHKISAPEIQAKLKSPK